MGSTGWVLLNRQDLAIVEDGTIKTDWKHGGRWWTPHRYLIYFREFDALIERLKDSYSFDFAAEDIAWGGESAPGLFALHPRIWEWAFNLKKRLVYLNWSRWYHWMVLNFKISREERDIEGKSLSSKLFTTQNGRRPSCSDVADAWGVSLAASRFLDLLEGRIKRSALIPKEQEYFDYTRIRIGPSGSRLQANTGLLHEKDINWFDWTGETDG